MTKADIPTKDTTNPRPMVANKLQSNPFVAKDAAAKANAPRPATLKPTSPPKKKLTVRNASQDESRTPVKEIRKVSKIPVQNVKTSQLNKETCRGLMPAKTIAKKAASPPPPSPDKKDVPAARTSPTKIKQASTPTDHGRAISPKTQSSSCENSSLNKPATSSSHTTSPKSPVKRAEPLTKKTTENQGKSLMAPKRDDSPLKSQGAWTASKVGLATKPTRRSSRPGSTVKPSKAPSSVTSSAHLSVDEPLPKPPSSIASIKDNSTVNGNDSVSHPYAKEPTFDHMPGVGPINYTSMIQQLSFSYAVMVASHYPTVSIDEAELLKEQYEHARSMLARLRTRIRFETSIQRGTTTVLKCAMADEVYLEELRSNSVHIEQLVDELYYGFERANELQAQYLQHVAGTLSSTPTTLPEPHHGDQRLKPDYDHLLARLQSITQKYVKVPPCGSYGGITKAGARMNSVSDDGSISGDSVFSKSVRTSVTSMDAELYYHGLATHDHLLDMIEKRLAESRLVSEGSARHQEVQTVALPLTVNDDKKQVDKWQKNEASIVAKCTQVLNKDEPAALSAIQAVDQLIERVMQWRENYDQQLDELRQQTQRDTETISKCEQTIRTQQEQIVQLKQTCSDLRAERAEYESKYLRLEEMQNNSVSLLEKQLQEMKTDCAVKGQELLKLNGFLKDAQEQFTLRESAFLLQAASLEAELGNVLKEYDRVTRNITDFNAERHKYQQQLLTVTHENRHLDKLLADERLKHVAKDGHSMTLRKEFRQLMASAKVEHQRALERELLQRQQLERDLWEIRRELDGKQWERIHQGVQTHYVIT